VGGAVLALLRQGRAGRHDYVFMSAPNAEHSNTPTPRP
jgi:hypothetical protein